MVCVCVCVCVCVFDYTHLACAEENISSKIPPAILSSHF